MFTFTSPTFPGSVEELSEGIRNCLSQYVALAPGRKTVSATAAPWPHLTELTIDLTDSRIQAAHPPAPPSPRGRRAPGITVAQLRILARPIRYQNSQADFSLEAHDVAFDFAHDARGNAMLVLANTSDGNLRLSIDGPNLQTLLRAAADAFAKHQGVIIQDLQVKLKNDGPRAISGQVQVKAKKLLFSGAVTLFGRVEIDEAMVATPSELSCKGEGAIGSMAANLIQGKLNQFSGRRIPLTAFSLGDLSLRDLELDTRNGLAISARFGGR